MILIKNVFCITTHIVMFFFAVLAALIKFLSQQIHPFEQAFFRNFIGVLIILPFILKYKIKISKKRILNY